MQAAAAARARLTGHGSAPAATSAGSAANSSAGGPLKAAPAAQSAHLTTGQQRPPISAGIPAVAAASAATSTDPVLARDTARTPAPPSARRPSGAPSAATMEKASDAAAPSAAPSEPVEMTIPQTDATIANCVLGSRQEDPVLLDAPCAVPCPREAARPPQLASPERGAAAGKDSGATASDTGVDESWHGLKTPRRARSAEPANAPVARPTAWNQAHHDEVIAMYG